MRTSEHESMRPSDQDRVENALTSEAPKFPSYRAMNGDRATLAKAFEPRQRRGVERYRMARPMPTVEYPFRVLLDTPIARVPVAVPSSRTNLPVPFVVAPTSLPAADQV